MTMMTSTIMMMMMVMTKVRKVLHNAQVWEGEQLTGFCTTPLTAKVFLAHYTLVYPGYWTLHKAVHPVYCTKDTYVPWMDIAHSSQCSRCGQEWFAKTSASWETTPSSSLTEMIYVTSSTSRLYLDKYHVWSSTLCAMNWDINRLTRTISLTYMVTTVVIFPPFINEKNIMYAVHTVCIVIWYGVHTMHTHSFTQCTVTQSMLRHQEPQQKSLWLIWAHSYGEHKINRSLHISCHTLISPDCRWQWSSY